METAGASVGVPDRQLERVKELVVQRAIEQRLVDEEDPRLVEARDDRGAEAFLNGARAGLEAAETTAKTLGPSPVRSDAGPV